MKRRHSNVGSVLICLLPLVGCVSGGTKRELFFPYIIMHQAERGLVASIENVPVDHNTPHVIAFSGQGSRYVHDSFTSDPQAPSPQASRYSQSTARDNGGPSAEDVRHYVGRQLMWVAGCAVIAVGCLYYLLVVRFLEHQKLRDAARKQREEATGQ